MRNALLPALLSAVALVAAAPVTAAIDAQSLLAAADAVRNPAGSFSVQVDLTEYRNRREVGQSSLLVYSKPAPDSGQYNNLLRYLAPSDDANKLLLRNGRDLWFFDPSSKATIRISPQARLLGQASNGDVMSTNFARDYKAVLVGTETVKDSVGTSRTAAHLGLTASGPGATYGRADLWIDPGSAQPIKAEFRTAEGRLLKIAYFRGFKDVLGKSRPTETVIIDGVNPNWVTVMKTSNYAKRDVPQSWLQRDYLPRFGGTL